MLCFIHEIDYVNFLFNVPKSLKCKSGNRSNLDMDVEDFATIKSEHSIDNHKFGVRINLDFIRKIEKRSCKIFFENGEIFWDLKLDKLIVKKRKSFKKNL